jgi:hypothetical protein
MRWVALLLALAVSLAVAGCGDGGGVSSSDRESIMRSMRAYFVFDRSPDFDAYCRSFVSVHDQHTFRQGSPEELASDAAATQRSCLKGAQRLLKLRQRYPNAPIHTGWPETQIGEVQEARKVDRVTVSLSYRIRGRTVSPDPIVARIVDGDWRVLTAGYD